MVLAEGSRPITPDMVGVLENPPQLSKQFEEISINGYFDRGTPLYLPREHYDFKVSRDVLSDLRFPWEVTDALWQRKYPEGIPPDDKVKDLNMIWTKSSLEIDNGSDFSVSWNLYRDEKVEVRGSSELAYAAKDFILRDQVRGRLVARSMINLFRLSVDLGLINIRSFSF